MNVDRKFRIAVIPGDGIGNEVVPEGLRVLDRLAATSGGTLAFEYESFPWGCEYYLRTGRMIDDDALPRLAPFDAIYFGAVGWPGVPDHVSLWGLRLAICQGFDQYACVRPVRLLPGIEPRLVGATRETMDWVVVRENSEGEYAGIGGRNLSGRGRGKEIALQASLFTEEGCERIIRYAFALARTRKRRKVTSVTKSNAQQYGMVLWDETFARIAAEHPDVESTWWSGRTFLAIFFPISAARSRAASGSRLPPTSIPNESTRACSSRCTAPRPTSSARESPTRLRRSGARR